MRIFVYVLKFDSGFAPNPFHGWCTLACCKPAIRRTSRPGDWIVGLTPRALGNRVAYAMRVEESLSFEEYWSDPRFKTKRPRWKKRASRVDKRGDNCYEPLGNDKFRQLPSAHWDHEHNREGQENKAKDLRGKCVLVARRFCYFGANARPFPGYVSFKRPARFHRVNFTKREKSALLRFLETLPQGIHGQPRLANGRHVLAAAGEAMRLILSRKGFDSSTGGCPSPIFPDGSMIALPIPDKRSPIRYQDLNWRGRNLGEVVVKLTRGKQRSDYRAHLDPDLREDICPREPGWRRNARSARSRPGSPPESGRRGR